MTDLTSSKTVFRCRFHSLMAVILILFLIVTGFMGCDQKKAPIKVGFVGPLSGRLSVLGVAGRNGATLAVEEANGTGGVNGHPVELIVRNDEQDEKKALKSDKELLNENVAAILNQNRFFGVQGDFSLDGFGDPQRDHFLMVSSAGRFRGME